LSPKRSGAILPVLLLALLAQLLAPVWAGVGMARTMSGAPGATSICISSYLVSIPNAPARETPDTHDDCCAVCHFLQSSFAPPPSAWDFVPPTLLSGYAAWTANEVHFLGLIGRFHVQARAPPSLS
jgi:hypothetical protein